jgi:hypothetical protein
MPQDKRKKAQPTRKRKEQKQPDRTPQRRSGDTVEPARSPQSDQPRQPAPPGSRPRPGAGLDKSDEGVIAGRRLAGKRFTG